MRQRAVRRREPGRSLDVVLVGPETEFEASLHVLYLSYADLAQRRPESDLRRARRQPLHIRSGSARVGDDPAAGLRRHRVHHAEPGDLLSPATQLAGNLVREEPTQ